jgi:hypothetical protein
VRKRFTPPIILAVVALAATGMGWTQDDPRIGTWLLNVARSRYTPGPPPAKEIRTYTAVGHTTNVSVESVDQHGTRVSLQYVAAENGKDYPITGLASADAIAMRRIDGRTFEADTKKNGKIIGTTRGEISTDGRVLKLTFKSISPAGQAITNVAVYDKQRR